MVCRLMPARCARSAAEKPRLWRCAVRWLAMLWLSGMRGESIGHDPLTLSFDVIMEGGFERAVELTSEEKERYSRQILFAGLGEDGQERLLQAQAAIVGCGALGSFQAAALARAGVGHLTIVDRDYVEPGNLQRQWLFEEADAAEALPKAVAAGRRLKSINSSVQVRGVVADLTPANIDELLGGAQVILDGTDNFETRYLLNDFALSRGIPWIYGAAVGSYGLTMPVIPGRTACLQMHISRSASRRASHLRDRRRAELDHRRDRRPANGGRVEDSGGPDRLGGGAPHYRGRLERRYPADRAALYRTRIARRAARTISNTWMAAAAPR